MLGKTEGKRRKVRQRMIWLDSITDSMDMDLGKFQEIVKIPCCSGSQTWLSNWKHTYCKYILKIWATIQVSKLDKLVSLYVTGFLWIIVSLGNETEEAMANHYSTLAWKIPWMEEPGRLQSMGLLRLGHNRVNFTFTFHALEKEMATHSSVLVWRTPGAEEPGGLPSMGSHRVGHEWSNLAAGKENKL